MAGLWHIGLGVFVLLLLPATLCVVDGRRIPMPAHGLLATCGLIYWTVAMGWPGTALSLVSGAGSAFLLGLLVAVTQNRTGRRILSGGEIQLFSAAAMWLPPAGAALAFVIAASLAIAWIAFRHARGHVASRPLLPLLGAAPLVFAIFGHN